MTDDRRHATRPFDAALIQSFLNGRLLKSAELFSLGKSSSNYRLVLDDNEVLVVRLLPRPTAARERKLLGLVRELVPVPAVLDGGEDWLILTFIDGGHLADAPECTAAAAEALGRIASIRFETAGWIEADGSISPFDFGQEGDFAGSMLKNEEVRRWIGMDAANALSRMLAQQEETRAGPPGEICLCHGDFNPTNILVKNGAVSGILDWEFAHAGDRYMDLGNLLRKTPREYREQIRAGYETAGGSLPDDWKKRAEFSDLSSHLEFLTSARADPFKQECARWIHDFIARYGQA